MQYTLPTATAPDIVTIEQALAMYDPSALIDVDASDGSIRISTVATQPELLASLREAGIAGAAERLVRVPSQCCGGCGG